MSELRLAMDEFFVSVQCKAYRQAEFATGCRDEAMDIVQDSMMRLAQKYSEQRESWPKLFQRILQNAIRDWHRRKKVRSVIFWFQKDSSEREDFELEESDQFAADEKVNPMEQVQGQQGNEKVFSALKSLPERQQQAFILRAWWEYSTKDCAFAMGCSEGSVKTHYSRALSRLGEMLAGEEI